jgi:hypothetical protein
MTLDFPTKHPSPVTRQSGIAAFQNPKSSSIHHPHYGTPMSPSASTRHPPQSLRRNLPSHLK